MLRKAGEKMSNCAVAKLSFEMFCERRNYQILSFMVNYRNREQYLGEYMDYDSMETGTILITKSGKYYQLLGNKKYQEIDYVLKEEEENGIKSIGKEN